MSARKKHLDIVTVSIGGSSIITDLQDVEIFLENVPEDARNITDRHLETEIVKRDITMTAKLMQTSGGARQSNLHVTTADFGATAYAADVIAGSLRITTNNFDGSADKDEWRFPNASGTEIRGQLTMLIGSAATGSLFATAGGALSGLAFTLTLAIGTLSFVCAMKITNVRKKSQRQGAIEVIVDVEQNGVPGTYSGDTLLVDIGTGDAIATYAFDDSVDSISGDALITEASLEWNQAALLIRNITLKNQGTPTFA